MQDAGAAEKGTDESRPVLWLEQGDDLYVPGLVRYGLVADQLFLVSRLHKGADCLWAMEQALRCPALSAVVAEVDTVSLTAGRRLQLAAEEGGVSGLVLARPSKDRSGRRAENNSGAFVTRWQVSARPSLPEDALPGIGAPVWQVELSYCRGGRPGQWQLLWQEDSRQLKQAGAQEDGSSAASSVRLVG
jgi:protein ImuA